jgi:hypothetical protein
VAADLSQLSVELDGELVAPGDAGWEAARHAWNLAVDQSPVAVAEVAGADDVARVVRFAAEHGCRSRKETARDPRAARRLASPVGYVRAHPWLRALDA